MKDLIRRTLLFLGGTAAIMVAATIYFEVRVRQTDDFFRQLEWFRRDDVKPVVLLVGDSRMAMNVDQQHLPPGFYNFSYPGETLRHIYLRVKFALETKPSIRYLVLGLEDVGFSDARARLRDATRQTLFADLVDLTEVYPSSPKFLLRHAVLHYAPLVNASQRRRTWETLVDDVRRLVTGQADESAYRLVCGNMELTGSGEWANLGEMTRRQRARLEVEELYGGSASNPEMHRVLYKILAEARRRGVKVIGVRNPVSGSYIQAADALYDASALDFLDREQWLYAMLDYKTLFAEQVSLFYDADHLNSDGARRYTSRLVADLRPLVHLDARRKETASHCGGMMQIEPRSWPYNDVVTEWLRTPACYNLSGDCGKPLGLASRDRSTTRPVEHEVHEQDGLRPRPQNGRHRTDPHRSSKPSFISTGG